MGSLDKRISLASGNQNQSYLWIARPENCMDFCDQPLKLATRNQNSIDVLSIQATQASTDKQTALGPFPCYSKSNYSNKKTVEN